MEAHLVAPVTILEASFWILSRSFDSYCVQLFHITSTYSRSGPKNEKIV